MSWSDELAGERFTVQPILPRNHSVIYAMADVACATVGPEVSPENFAYSCLFSLFVVHGSPALS